MTLALRIRIAARGSALSLAQVEIVRQALEPRVDVEVLTVRTSGDQLSHLDAAIEGKGIFTKEIDEALLAGRADVGVHSLKDLPSRLPSGLVLAAVPLREDPCDALIAHPHRTFAALPRGARVGTASPRRKAQLLAVRPDLEICEVRGNVDTRVRRLREGKWDAIVLARAGLARLGRLHEISDVFSEEVMLPAIGQGALALVVREDDKASAQIVASLDHPLSHREATAERALLSLLEAGCRAPLAGRAAAGDGTMRLVAAVFSLSGDRVVREESFGSLDDPQAVGEAVARKLLARGAADLIGEARG
jgi:hydroxymethylbilane synthase